MNIKSLLIAAASTAGILTLSTPASAVIYDWQFENENGNFSTTSPANQDIVRGFVEFNDADVATGSASAIDLRITSVSNLPNGSDPFFGDGGIELNTNLALSPSPPQNSFNFIGFMLVFLRPEKQSIKRSELRILSLLSWLALLSGIICCLFAPLLISNSLRINSNNTTNINLQLTNQRQQIERVGLQIDNLNEVQLQNLWQRNQSNSAANINISAAEKKQQLTNKLNSSEQANRQQLQQTLKNQQRSLFKMTFKWVLGAILAGITFISLWRYTEWTREFLKAAKYEV